MRFSALQLRRCCWLALLAVFALAVVPTLSRAMDARLAHDSLLELCSQDGKRAVVSSDAAAGERGDAPLAAIHLEHCPLCAASAAALGLPPASATMQWLSLTESRQPARLLHAPRTTFAWRTAQPRAPPSFS
jgi:hypothetical protein